MGTARYDAIGRNYSQFRQTEPTWAAQLDAALGPAQHVLNVGAGTGNYENLNRRVSALEPSKVMIEQRDVTASPCVQGVAEALPFVDDAFDATMGVLTMHHWPDRLAGLAELARVAGRHVYTVYEAASAQEFWLLDYFPETRLLPMERAAPNAATIDSVLRVIDEQILWVPRDCVEGFAAASWARPHDYLDPEMQRAISLFALSEPNVRERGTAKLAADLESGAWHDKYGDMLELDQADFGYRLVIAERR